MKRITILTGHYGSGKSEIAVNLALKYPCDMLVDLDVINPYFRSRSARDILAEKKIEIIESTIENASGSDLPFISSKGSRPFVNKDLTAIYDLGGTTHGAKLMKQFDKFIDPKDDIDFLMVVNIYRGETQTVEQILQVIENLEGASQLNVTGLINNTNLMDYTDQDTILEGQEILLEVSKIKNIPILYTVIEEHVKVNNAFIGEQLILRRYLALKAQAIGGKYGKR